MLLNDYITFIEDKTEKCDENHMWYLPKTINVDKKIAIFDNSVRRLLNEGNGNLMSLGGSLKGNQLFLMMPKTFIGEVFDNGIKFITQNRRAK